MINVIATIFVKEGKSDEFLKTFRELMPVVHAEDGCIAYAPSVDVEIGSVAQVLNPNSFAIVERWETVEALAAHSNAPHMAEFKIQMKDVIEKMTLQVTKDL